MSTLTMNQDEIADAIEDLNPNFALLVREGETIFTIEESPFVNEHSIIRVEVISTSHPVLFFVAKQPDGGILLLTGNPDAFHEVIRKEKITIKEDQAISFTDLYIEATQDRQTPLYVLNAFDDIPYLHELDAEELQKKHRDRNQYGEKIKPPIVKREGNSFRVERYLLHGKELQFWTFEIAPDGAMKLSQETIGSDVGIYYWQ